MAVDEGQGQQEKMTQRDWEIMQAANKALIQEREKQKKALEKLKGRLQPKPKSQ